jgi:hypothetical protein
MSRIVDGHNYSRDARAEMNGEINGSKWLTEQAMKIVVGVVTATIITALVFGVRVYAFMSAGERFTPSMHEESVQEAWREAREVFVESDVYERDREYLDRRLNRIEDKLDEIIRVHQKED